MKFCTILLFVLFTAASGFSQTNSVLSHDIFFQPEFRTTRLFGPELNANLIYTFSFLEHYHVQTGASLDVGHFVLSAYRFGFYGTLDFKDFGFLAGIFFLDQGFPQFGSAYHSVIPVLEAHLWGFRVHGGLSQNFYINDTNNLWNIFYYYSRMPQLSYELGISYLLELMEKRYTVEFGFNNYELLRVVYFTAFGFYVDQKYHWDDRITFELQIGIRMTGSLDLTAQINEFFARAGVEVVL